ncbi:toll/interleukin-1 receptor domain-containing protein [Chromobacterium alkanivorans]|uniref:toll/interleukin-1 receptor domain-containing protein n=1 Tax=Chromobacterium alkanivorans TaxID=1071719 RepID=UPI00196839B9|nr:toll/interleukin-1 receptor domain-containing protein [Chromobacterium alkanivorans]MBN3002553.1 toll/interleukin-1 receptor domain-containing protein [Chromobacterium alkanivorans]
MSNRDFIWECDYGEHTRFTNALKILASEQNAYELGMCALFVNNNPYNLEFFVVLSYENPKDGQIEKMLEMMTGVGARQRPDIPMNELMVEIGGKRFNSMTVVGVDSLEQAEHGLFQFKERKDVSKIISMKPLGKRLPVFLSHSSSDKPFVEDVIPYLSSQGLPVWYDKLSIDYGESILSAVQSGVKDSGAVIFFITKSFINSSWCKLEMEGFLSRYAGGHGVLLLSVVANDVNHEDLPFFLQNIKYLKLSGEYDHKSVASELLPVLKKHFKL